jgi:putative hydrolase of the HAD superfamily
MFHTIFFDLDNTIYPADCGLWEAIGMRIELFLIEEMHMQLSGIHEFRLYCRENYGTTLQGLKSLYQINEDDYLKYVHHVDLSQYLVKDPNLAGMLRSLTHRKIILTNADEAHARNVLSYLEIEDQFADIIDVKKMSPFVKPEPESYQKALDLTGLSSASGCVFVDDYLPNVVAAEQSGFLGILISANHHSDFPHRVESLFDLPDFLEKQVAEG